LILKYNQIVVNLQKKQRMSHQETKGFVDVLIENKIATITFYHPASNSFPSSLLQQMVLKINQLSVNDAVSVIVLQSENEVFCAGASFDELLAVSNTKEGTTFFSGFANVINAMRKCPKLIIGRVQGKAVGGGVGIIAACDYVVATETSALKLSEIAIGIGPFVIEPAITRKIGVAGFSDMSLSPTQWKTADWALQKGLFSKVVATIDQLNDAINQKAIEMTSYNPASLLEMKKVFWQNTDHWDELLLKRASISGNLVLSDFTKQALNAFKK
jgi:methylglutaconyl-CoA hydratase